MRILGIDFGDARIGIAVSDIMGWTAQGVGTVYNKGWQKTAPELEKIIKEYNPEKIVLGLPKNMDGTQGSRAEECKEIANKIGEKSQKEIVMWDERCTTISAHTALNYTDTRGKKRKNVVDAVAAVIILEDYLAYRKNQR